MDRILNLALHDYYTLVRIAARCHHDDAAMARKPLPRPDTKEQLRHIPPGYHGCVMATLT